MATYSEVPIKSFTFFILFLRFFSLLHGLIRPYTFIYFWEKLPLTSYTPLLKVAFIQKVRFVFQISKKICYKLLSWACCSILVTGSLNFMFRILSELEYFLGRFGDLKNTSHFLKKASFRTYTFISFWENFPPALLLMPHAY